VRLSRQFVLSTGNYSEGVLLNPSLGATYNPDKDDLIDLPDEGVGAFNLAYISGLNDTEGFALSGDIRF
jgi:hypothetical protein